MPGSDTFSIRARWLLVAGLGWMAVFPACDQEIDATDRTSAAEATEALRHTQPEPSEQPWTLTLDGLGPIQLESTVGQLAPKITLRQVWDRDGNCWYARPLEAPDGVLLMMDGETVVRIEVHSPSKAATPEGLSVGSTVTEVRATYPDSLDERPHKYVSGEYLVHPSESAERQIVFETEEGVVTTFRAGIMPMVRWVEGCS